VLKNIEQYKATFSQVHTDVTIRMEDYKKMKRSNYVFKKFVIAAAVLCLFLASTITAYAMNLFGLKDMILGNNSEVIITTPAEDGTTAETTIPSATISVQGYADSNEYKAMSEWSTFLDGYDQDGALLNEVGNGPTGLDEKYNLYMVYTQEMADKLEEITAKYELELHTSMQVYSSREELFQMAGTGDFLETIHEVGGYIYEDGTFHYDGEANLSDGKTINYQFGNYKKGSFTDVTLNIGDTEDYDEWTYETAGGITVTIASSPYKSLLTADLENSFVNINILPELSSGEITADDLEAFADSIDFSML